MILKTKKTLVCMNRHTLCIFIQLLHLDMKSDLAANNCSTVLLEQMEKSAQRRCKHCALAVVRRSQKCSPRRRFPSRGRGTAKI